MDSGGESIRSETDKAADAKAAGEPSPDSTESFSRRRGPKRRLTNAVTSEGSGISTAAPVRVLRARRGEAGRTGDFNNAACTNKTVILLRGRGRPAETRTKNTPVLQKKPPVQYVRCEMEGCGTVLAHPRYLQHHIKYQHLLKKKYVCDHPSCGRLFRLQKQLLRHAKHHTDQRDYICKYCARAFKSSHNLSVHRMIHTGKKPIQCEICGFTCRHKASLNWHTKKHDAEASYQFSCSICGKRFEKKDSVVAHKAKSHPEVLRAEALAANGGSVIKQCHTQCPDCPSDRTA